VVGSSRNGGGEEEVFMPRSPSRWGRALAALLVVMACTLAAPPRANAAALNMDTFYVPASRLWDKAVDWVRSFWRMPARNGPDSSKFGAGQSSDGRTKSTPSF
jgi:hypothetical protein